MRKLSKSRKALIAQSPEIEDRSGRISGATITSWPGPASMDFTALFTLRQSHATVSGTTSRAVGETAELAHDSVSLSDGTRITFVYSNDILLEGEV